MTATSARRPAALTAVLAVVAGVTLAPEARADDLPTVTVVHGIPGQPLDVHIDGTRVLAGLGPGTVSRPLKFRSGTYEMALTRPGEPAGSAIVADAHLELARRRNISVVAHLSVGDRWVLSTYFDDTGSIRAGDARLIVRHTADAPAVDLRAEGRMVFAGLTNPREMKTDLPAATVEADVVLAGTGTVVLGPATVRLIAGVGTIVYAIGSVRDGTAALVTATAGEVPSGVPAGAGGLARTGVGAWWYLLVAAGLVLTTTGGLTLIARRRTVG